MQSMSYIAFELMKNSFMFNKFHLEAYNECILYT